MGSGEGEAGDEGGQFLVLAPRRAEGTPEFVDPALQRVGGEAKFRRGPGVELPLLHGRQGQPAVLAGVDERVPEKFALGGMDEGVGGERGGEGGRRPARGQEDATADGVMTFFSEVAGDRAEGAAGEEPGAGAAATDELRGGFQVQSLGGMIGLPGAGNAGVGEFNASPVDERRRAWRPGDHHERRPARVDPQTQRGARHTGYLGVSQRHRLCWAAILN